MEKYHLILIQSELDKNLNEIFFIKNSSLTIGSDECCDIVLKLDTMIDPQHVRVVAENDSDYGIEDISDCLGVVKEKNGNKIYLKKKREYEFLQDRFFYLNSSIKLSLLEGTYDELKKKLAEEDITYFDYYLNSLANETRFKELETSPVREESLTLEFVERDGEIINEQVLGENFPDKELLNFYEQNPIDLEEFNNFDYMSRSIYNEELSQEEVKLNDVIIERELLNTRTIEENQSNNLSPEYKLISDKEEDKISDEINLKMDIDPAKLIDSLLPDLNDKSDISVIEEIIKNSQLESPIDNIIHEKEQILEQMEEKIENQAVEDTLHMLEHQSIKEQENILENMIDRALEKKENLDIRDISNIVAERIKEKGIILENPEGSYLSLSGTKNKTKGSDKFLNKKRPVNIFPGSEVLYTEDEKQDTKTRKEPDIFSKKRIDDSFSSSSHNEVKSEVFQKNTRNKIIDDSEEERLNFDERTPIRTPRKKKKEKVQKETEEKLSDEEDEEIIRTTKNSNPSKDISTTSIHNTGKVSTKQKIQTKPNLKISFIDEYSSDNKLNKQIKSLNLERVDEQDTDVFLCNKLSKNPKLLIAINKRKPILSFKWLEKSILNKKIEPYDKFYVKDREFERKYSFDLHTLLSETPFADHLSGHTFYVCDHVYNKDDIEEIIESAGGECIQTYKTLKKKRENVVVIADSNHDRDDINKMKASKYDYQIYSSDLILDSVFTQSLDLKKNKYKI